MLVVSVLVACSSVFVSWTTAEGAEPPDDPRNATHPRLDPRVDLKPAAASGYIFRHDANSKPTLIRFGDHNLDQLEEFLKKTGGFPFFRYLFRVYSKLLRDERRRVETQVFVNNR